MCKCVSEGKKEVVTIQPEAVVAHGIVHFTRPRLRWDAAS